MTQLLEGFAVMLGREPQKPARLTPAAQTLVAAQNSPEGKAQRKRRR